MTLNSSIITNAAGIGGGGAILPIMMLFRFTVSQAVALSNTVIFIGAVTRFALDFNEKHPMKKATIIDYGVVVIMMPWIMIGSFIGTQANVAAPSAIILGILLIVMIFISYRSTKQGLKLYHEETRSVPLKEVLKNCNIGESDDLEINEENQIELQNLENDLSRVNSIAIKSNDSLNTIVLKKIKRKERSHFQVGKISIIVLSILILIFISLIRKNEFDGIMNHIDKWSTTDLFIWLFFLLSMIVILFWSIRILTKEFNLKQKVRYHFEKGDIEWSSSIISNMLIVAILGGLLSSFVGLGGGIIFGPLMLEFGVHPRVSSSTSMYMVMLSTLVAVVQYIVMGILPLDYSLGFWVIIIIFTIIGHETLSKQLKKFGKPSIFALFLAGVIIVWSIVILIFSVETFADKISKGESLFKFNNYWE